VLWKVADMQSNRLIEPPESVPGVLLGLVHARDDGVAARDGHATVPTPGETLGPADPPSTSNRGRSPFARLPRVVRGDKYMADAYEPALSALMATRAGATVVHDDDERAARVPHSRVTPTVGGDARAVAQARLDMDRWVDEGGMVPFEAAAVLRATTSRR